jgi:hypothetical protein
LTAKVLASSGMALADLTGRRANGIDAAHVSWITGGGDG